MRHPVSTLFLLLALCTAAQAQRRNRDFEAYINKWQETAVTQMERYKIPASITLAQGLLESGAGKSRLAVKSNNHFGIKCGSSWRGRTVRHTDDAPNECFRAYYNAKQSYEDHSKFLTTNKRYASLFKLDITDYRGWAKGLKRAGYATSPSYASRLIQIIEDYDLYKYDVKESRRKRRHKDKKRSPVPHQPLIANGLAYVVAREGDTFKSIGKEVGIKSKKLASYNDLWKDYPLMPGDIVYLHKKNKKYVGSQTFHVVRDGDSMHSISQTYGIRLERLYELNGKSGEYVPEVGDRVWVK